MYRFAQKCKPHPDLSQRVAKPANEAALFSRQIWASKEQKKNKECIKVQQLYDESGKWCVIYSTHDYGCQFQSSQIENLYSPVTTHGSKIQQENSNGTEHKEKIQWQCYVNIGATKYTMAGSRKVNATMFMHKFRAATLEWNAGNVKLNCSWQCFTTVISGVLNSFINSRLMTKCNDWLWVWFRGRVTVAYRWRCAWYEAASVEMRTREQLWEEQMSMSMSI